MNMNLKLSLILILSFLLFVSISCAQEETPLEEISEVPYQVTICGDGNCARPLEDKYICPEDCDPEYWKKISKEEREEFLMPFKLSLIFVGIVVVAFTIFVVFKYREIRKIEQQYLLMKVVKEGEEVKKDGYIRIGFIDMYTPFIQQT